MNFRHPICSQWNSYITKWRNEYKKGLLISDTQFVRNGIIITKWRNNFKNGYEFQTPNLFAME